MARVVEFEEFTADAVSNHGRGLDLKYGFGVSQFGDFIVAVAGDAICYINFVDNGEQEALELFKGGWWSGATFTRSDRLGDELSGSIFTEERALNKIKVMVWGSDLRMRVWREIAKVPFGQTISYSELAARAGNERAVRAVATSVGLNPVSMVIPCHRIIRRSGDTGNYASGPARKEAILQWEGVCM